MKRIAFLIALCLLVSVSADSRPRGNDVLNPCGIGQIQVTLFGEKVCYEVAPLECQNLACTCAQYDGLYSEPPIFCCDVENFQNPFCSPLGSCGIADFNSDQKVDGADLGLLLGGWGLVEEDSKIFDIATDGEVGQGDVSILLYCWSK